MIAQSPNPAPCSPVSWGIALAAGSLLLIGGGAIVWSSQAGVPEPPPPSLGEQVASDVGVLKRDLPLAPTTTPFHSIAYTMENGTRVVKIKVVDTGDELVVDATTGRLLEARPSRPTAPPPAGRFAAPFQPMT